MDNNSQFYTLNKPKQLDAVSSDMDRKREAVLTDGHLYYDLIEGQFYRCRACGIKTSASAIETRLHYYRCKDKN